jgi:hypothetical protein
MFPKAEKSCCNKAGQCERTSKNAPVKECERMPLQQQGFSFVQAELAVVASTADPIFLPPVLKVLAGTLHSEAPLAEHSPPDLYVLHSTFLI